MANLAKWSVSSTASAVNFMTTTLATLASSTLSAVSSATQVNSSQLRMYFDAALIVGSTAGPYGVGNYFALYAVPLVDGSGSNTAELDKAELEQLAIFPCTTSTANAQHVIARRLIAASPSDFQVAIYNGTTQALSTGSGANTLTLNFYDVNLNG